MIKKTFYIIFGIICLFIGLVGFLVPFLPGWPFFFIGIGAISPKHGKGMLEWVKKKIQKIRRK